MALRSDDISITTIIGAGSSVEGDVHITGVVHIYGDINGNLDTDGNVFLGEKARIHGNIHAKSVTVCGIVYGDILASDNVKLLSSSAVLGDIIAKKLQVEDNVIVHGHCISLSNEDEYARASEQYLQAKAIRKKAIFHESSRSS
ncbi:MAG: polymer-forming cytoskeletal protein [Treponema sp.]|nr:polymer-forming cytoskeletal protein [Treponema sp.]